MKDMVSAMAMLEVSILSVRRGSSSVLPVKPLATGLGEKKGA
jgi:hypothetical protein